ncbi:helix-turn-helix domain-containing protein [Streptomyces xiamenensis]|uniref:helix-turn-helix domain-containing protein n=1 Tax=Streptomyces xiamenensis TaxID=408015 RepID=UPI0035D6E3B2
MSTSVNTNALAILRDLGEELRRIRMEAGYKSQADAAKQLKCSQNKVSYIERGQRWPDESLLKRMFKVYELPEPRQADIRATIRTGKSIERPWWLEPQYRELLTAGFGQTFALEDAAEKVHVHSGTYIPGLFQTQEYIEALAAFGQKDESVIRRELFVETRLRRQHILTRNHPVVVNAIFLESALRPVVGGADTMRGQLRHLRTLAARPNISVRVVPFTSGAAAAVGSPFTLYDYPGGHNKTVVMHEMSRGGGEATDGVAEVRRMRRRFADLAEHALDAVATLQLIEGIENGL